MARSQSSLVSVLLIAAVCSFAGKWAFVSAPQAQQVSLRGAEATYAAAAATLASPLAATAADELIEYPMAGEITVTNIVYFFAITLGGTAFAFASYFALTKLKII
eukprot:CAMPEP_0178400936 /NCGR_PEP_ID=MMETSP0689_2-20121128/16044_1 /TAXON_ID=160604 /ORGANISM="Amphidinium massartii, Strain CS-259" /LENGTH=104 /DNA_ID=CAMNT_0020021743 /DNA_START=258 /DNA_END=572 /DNA_ORIENTATION=+